MKRLPLFFTALLYFIGFSANSQSSAPGIGDNWNELVSMLERRIDLAINIATLLPKEGYKDKSTLNPVLLNARQLHSYLDTLHFGDSLVIATTVKKNNQLTLALAKLFVSMEGKPQRSNPKIMDLMIQLEGTENRIVVSTNSYNEACVKLKRKDLRFDPNRQQKAPNVKF